MREVLISKKRRILLLTRRLLLILLLIAGIGALSVYGLMQHVFIRDISYEPCNINYGERLQTWEGAGTETWDEAGYYYEARRFEIKAISPDGRFGTIAERNPKHISSDKNSEHACRADFDDVINLGAPEYRASGARTVAVRLGFPQAAGDVVNNQKLPKASPNLRPPLYHESYERAAWSVDDAAAAIIQVDDSATVIGCVGIEVTANARCQSIVRNPELEEPTRGGGFLFTEDNCPDEVRELAGYCDYFRPFVETTDSGLTHLLGKNEFGILQPFSLHLEAASTFAPAVSNSITLSFKYPKQPNLLITTDATKHEVTQGRSIDLPLHLQRSGPDQLVTDLLIESTAGITPRELSLSAEQQAQLQREDYLTLGVPLSAARETPEGCYPLSIKAVAREDDHFVDRGGAISLGEICVKAPRIVYQYRVEFRGEVLSNHDEFKRLAAETMNSVSSWAQAGLQFEEVGDGADFVLVLAEPSQVAAVSSACDAVYSCQVGSLVIINDLRWRTATDAWNGGGGNLRDYQHMVVNHELGHWLGFGHAHCQNGGDLAPVMQQQSIDLMGCRFNPWPLASEVAVLAARLGL